MESKLKIAILGGTGALGSGFAKRWAAAGHPIIIGSRSKDKAAEFARSISTTQNMQVSGEDMLTAARLADVVLLAVPFSSH
ncbi:MAG: NAD(P)-binding domain-containing protein [Burkholderiales bacterium]